MIEAAHDLGDREPARRRPAPSTSPGGPTTSRSPTTCATSRAREAVGKLLPAGREAEACSLNIENIFFNGYLMTPHGDERLRRLASAASTSRSTSTPATSCCFSSRSTGFRPLGKRIKNVHLKEFTKKGTDHSLESFRPLLDGTTNWPAVMEAFDAIGYRGYLTFEYFHPFPHYPEALIYQTSDRSTACSEQSRVGQAVRRLCGAPRRPTVGPAAGRWVGEAKRRLTHPTGRSTSRRAIRPTACWGRSRVGPAVRRLCGAPRDPPWGRPPAVGGGRRFQAAPAPELER